MSDEWVRMYRKAAEAIRGGEFDVEIPTEVPEECADLGEALRVLAAAVRERIEQSVKIAEISRRVNEGLILEDVLEQVYDNFRELIPYDRIGFALLDRKAGRVRAHWAKTEAAEIKLTNGYSALLEGSSLEKVVQSRRPRILGDLEAYLEANPGSDSTAKIVAEGMRSSLTCPLLIKGQPVGFLFFSSMQPHAYDEEHQEVFLQITDQLALTLERSRLYEELLILTEDLQAAQESLERLASRDSLTDLWNRRSILELLKREMARADREESPIAAVMIDIDHFKQINDRVGHLAGDEVLREVVRRVGGSLRSTDIFGRIGGEEFLVVLFPGDKRSAIEVMERARLACAAEPVSYESGVIEVTVSLGAVVATSVDGLDLPDLLRASDRALYRAKEGGRNRCELVTI